MAERIAYKGMTPSQLTGLTKEEYTRLATSRQRRSIKRNALETKALIEKVERHINSKSQKPIRTKVREAVILPSWVGLKFEIHNGKEFKMVQIAPNMLGHRLGELSFTTKRVLHSSPGIKATRGSKFLANK